MKEHWFQRIKKKEGWSVENPSLPVVSPQKGLHENLSKLCQRHGAREFDKIIRADNARAFEAVWRAFVRFQQHHPQAGWIVDSGCGTGESSFHLALANPFDFVLGVDQSENRLRRVKMFKAHPPENLFFVRADLIDFWRLMVQHGLILKKHYWFYPNPWPKPKHVQRRFYAHAVFPFVLQLKGVLECRSNWRIYVEELAWVLKFFAVHQIEVESFSPQEPISLFEKKYQQSGHLLWRIVAQL